MSLKMNDIGIFGHFIFINKIFKVKKERRKGRKGVILIFIIIRRRR